MNSIPSRNAGASLMQAFEQEAHARNIAGMGQIRFAQVGVCRRLPTLLVPATQRPLLLHRCRSQCLDGLTANLEGDAGDEAQ